MFVKYNNSVSIVFLDSPKKSFLSFSSIPSKKELLYLKEPILSERNDKSCWKAYNAPISKIPLFSNNIPNITSKLGSFTTKSIYSSKKNLAAFTKYFM